jgi:hypothetical protein
MDSASYYRERAEHLRRLAEMTWQDDLEALLRCVARDYDEIAEDLATGATEIRHPPLLSE